MKCSRQRTFKPFLDSFTTQEVPMRTIRQQYQAPALVASGDLIATTQFAIVGDEEADLRPKNTSGSVGFGI